MDKKYHNSINLLNGFYAVAWDNRCDICRIGNKHVAREYTKEEIQGMEIKYKNFINIDVVKKAIDDINKLNKKQIRIDHISHNIPRNILLKMFNAVGIHRDTYASCIELYGIPVFQKNYVPTGEMWMQDEDGMIVKRYKIEFKL